MVCFIFISSSSVVSMMRFLLLLIVVINIIEVSSSFPIGSSSSSSSSSSSTKILQLLPSRRRATTTTSLIGNKPCKRSFLTTTTKTATTTLRGGSNGNDGDESNTTIDDDNNDDSNKKILLKDYSNEASALFGNIRIPAALFSGASAGAAFAMPISLTATEGLKIGLVKRLYSFLMIGALSSEILAVVVSTLAVASLSMKSYPPKVPTKTLSDFIYKNNYELSWVTTRFHFLSGVLCFVMALGIRAWIVIVCPVFAKASLLLISSATLLCIAFIQDMGIIVKNNNDDNNKLGNILNLPVGYFKLFVSKAKKNPYFAIALGLYLLTFGYVTYMIPHIWNYLK